MFETISPDPVDYWGHVDADADADDGIFDTIAEANENLCLMGCGNSIPNSAIYCTDCYR